MCERCCDEQVSREVEDRQDEEVCRVSTGFLYNLSIAIQFPFKAIEIIVNTCERLRAGAIQLNSYKNKDDFDYFTFEFSFDSALPREDES